MRTVFDVVGAGEYTRAFKQAEDANRKLAVEEKKRDEDSPVSGRAARVGNLLIGVRRFADTFNEVSEALQRVAGFFRPVIDAANASADAFARQEASLFRVGLILRNLGRAGEIEPLTRFNQQMARLSGSTTEAVTELTALLATANLTQQEILRATPILIDFAAAAGIDVTRASEILTSALRGERDALQRYGADVDLAKDRAGRLADALSGLEARFRGAAAASTNLLSGSLTRLANAWNEVLASIGRVFGPALTHLVNAITANLLLASRALQQIAGILERVGILAPLSVNTEGIGGAGAAALGQGAEQTRLLREIAGNTKDLDDRLVRRVLGGPGQVAGQAVTWRDAALAFRS